MRQFNKISIKIMKLIGVLNKNSTVNMNIFKKIQYLTFNPIVLKRIGNNNDLGLIQDNDTSVDC